MLYGRERGGVMSRTILEIMETKAIKNVFDTRKAWLNNRQRGIGGSEAAAVLGLSKWLSNYDLFLIKTGQKEAEDISDKDYVRYGVKAEPLIRELFSLDNPQYEVIYEPYNSYQNTEYPFLLASLDGLLREKETGRLGLYEGKKADIYGKHTAAEWDGQIPQAYYCQILHYFIVIEELEFAVLNAQLKTVYDGKVVRTELRPYYFERKECLEDMAYLKAAEIKFWTENVLKNKAPARILPEI